MTRRSLFGRETKSARRKYANSILSVSARTPRREFLHVDDLADAIVYLLQKYEPEPILNAGWSEDLTIREWAKTVMSAIGYTGSLTFDYSKPDGTPRKLLDVSRL